jgi:hypothetical protein
VTTGFSLEFLVISSPIDQAKTLQVTEKLGYLLLLGEAVLLETSAFQLRQAKAAWFVALGKRQKRSRRDEEPKIRIQRLGPNSEPESYYCQYYVGAFFYWQHFAKKALNNHS